MINIQDKSYCPTAEELIEYTKSELFRDMCARLRAEFGAKCESQFSGDNNLPGWNLRFSKAGRTLCRLYPAKGEFKVLVVIGRREKERTEAILPEMSPEINALYRDTKEGMGQRWLMISLCSGGALYEDIFRLVAIRKGRII